MWARSCEGRSRKGPPEPVTVSSELRMWERALAGQGWKFRLLGQVWSKVVWFTPLAFACLGARTARSEGLPDLLRCVCGMFAMYSATTTAFYFGFRRRNLLAVVIRARRLADLAERDYGRFTEVAEGPARWMNSVRRNGTTYIKAGSFLALLEQFSGSPAIPFCIHPDDPWGRQLVALLESIKWSYLAMCFFSMWMLIACLLLSTHAQYRSLHRRLEDARGRRQLESCTRQLRHILLLEADLKRLFHTALFHVLSGAFIVPLINTYQLLFGERTMFTALTLSSLPLVYGSLSILGDKLAQGAEEVALAAYRAPHWTEGEGEETGERLLVLRLRLLVMQSSQRAAPFTMSVFGGFTRHDAYRVLRSWYQYLQLLINTVQTGGGLSSQLHDQTN